MSLSPVPLKTRRIGQRCTLNLSRAETSSRWCGGVVWRGGASSGVVHVTLTMVQNYVVLSALIEANKRKQLLPYNTFPEELVADFKLRSTCKNSLVSGKVPPLSCSNGFTYPPKQHELPTLDPISARLVSSPSGWRGWSAKVEISIRSPIREKKSITVTDSCRYAGCYAINVPVDVDTMVQQLPRQLDDDQVFNVNIKKDMIHKSKYLRGVVKKSALKAWLQFFIG
ncbi:ATP-dependent DNA helicase [Trichonephila clavipes]|nr:ATP-dependent DNA helicase [Trichonephila clavipes]